MTFVLESCHARSEDQQMDQGEKPFVGSPGGGAQRPQPAQLVGTLPPVRSRWQKGTLTLGPVGRLAWTFVATAPLLWLIKGVVVNGVLPGDRRR